MVCINHLKFIPTQCNILIYYCFQIDFFLYVIDYYHLIHPIYFGHNTISSKKWTYKQVHLYHKISKLIIFVMVETRQVTKNFKFEKHGEDLSICFDE